MTRRALARRRIACALALLSLATTSERRASASPGYDALLESELELSYEPRCTLCHEPADAGADGGGSTRGLPFARSLVARGLLGTQPETLSVALGRLRSEGVDSDGDGAVDLDELAWGGDPNVADLPTVREHPPAEYGCALSSRGEPVAGVTVLAAVVLAGGRARRRGLRGARRSEPPAAR